MLYREIIAICSEIHTKHINTAVWAECRVCVILVVYIVTTGVLRVSFLNGLSAFRIPVLKIKLEVEWVGGHPQDRQ